MRMRWRTYVGPPLRDDGAAAGRGPDLAARLDDVRGRSDKPCATLAVGREPTAPVALTLNGSLVSFGQCLGTIWGGAINDFGGLGWIGVGGAFLATGAFALACSKFERFAR